MRFPGYSEEEEEAEEEEEEEEEECGASIDVFSETGSEISTVEGRYYGLI